MNANIKKIYDDFVGKVDTEAMSFNIKPDQYSYGMVQNFLKYLEQEGYVIVKIGEICMPPCRTIPSCKEEAIELYGYDPKTKKYPWDKKKNGNNKKSKKTV